VVEKGVGEEKGEVMQITIIITTIRAIKNTAKWLYVTTEAIRN
jgi:hypothetical protein